ncbi:ADAMTS-like protein 1 [Holothuria leucospilota]|uniref:ADAMTS-like protein 1 n=1 Tax=Holothuria leucospilota TaxID=206669 RepID=A0A9Q1BMK5_HOLLE|nr:ADAMTS-like protein 1 [Holothuria leucospilota]
MNERIYLPQLYMFVALFLGVSAGENDVSSLDSSFEWSSWSNWSDCTRECGGGISRKSRECLFGACQGSLVQYRTCNTEPCPENTKDFRARQCEVYNDVQYNNQSFSWIPVTPLPAKNECALICQAEGHNLTRMLSPTVLDGTPCRLSSRDMCLNGKCVPIGCNYEFNSTTVLDRCLVCGGDNSSCKVQRGKKTSHLVDKGLEEIWLIPKGSFAVRILLKGSGSFLGVQTEDGRSGINQKTVSQGGNYIVGGTNIQFTIMKSGRTYISIPDKLNQSLWVTILRTKTYDETDPQDKIVFQYIAPISYSWKESEWSACSRSCGIGTRVKTWKCQDTVTREEVEETLCSEKRKADVIEECIMRVCPAEWKVDPWDDCSSTCGGGIQRRAVACTVDDGSGTIQYLSNEYCQIDRPPLLRACNTEECPRWYAVTDWSECSVTCATGLTTRVVQCLDYRGVEVTGCRLNGKPIESKRCHTRVPCLEGPGEDFVPPITPAIRQVLEVHPSYATYDWSPCSVSCSMGIRTRNVTCTLFMSHTQTFITQEDSKCGDFPKPNTTEVCLMPPCPVTPTRMSDESLDTTTTYDKETNPTKAEETLKTRVLPPVSPYLDDSSESSYSLSFPSESGYSVVDYEFSSYSAPGRRYMWRQTGFSECSRSCAGGLKESIIECVDAVTDEVVKDFRCHASEPLERSRHSCNEQPCPPKWNVMVYGECSMTCGSGLRYPVKVMCIQVYAESMGGFRSVPDSECQHLPRPGPDSCANIECPPHWIMNRWSSCTEACGRGTRSRRVSCIQLLGNGEEVEREWRMCSSIPPPETENCNEVDCPPDWLAGNFSACSVTCGQGQKSRQVICTQVLADGSSDILDPSRCPEETAPTAVEPCSMDVCFEPAIMANSSIFEQSETEGRIHLTVGQQATLFTKTTLIVHCPVVGLKKPNIQWLKGSSEVPHNRTSRVRVISGGSLKITHLTVEDTGLYTCVAGPLSENFYLTVVQYIHSDAAPDDYVWVTGEWSECTVTCGGGYQRRDVLCQHVNRRANDQLLNPEFCESTSKLKPDEIKICNRHLCTSFWDPEDWGKCSNNCRGAGLGTKTRLVRCKYSNGSFAPESECQSIPDLEMPATITDCQTDFCVPRWHVSRWTSCSVTCGQGRMKRKVRCMYQGTHKLAQLMQCQMLNPQPKVSAVCNQSDCPDAANPFEWDSL